jgi:hypothetical protein
VTSVPAGISCGADCTESYLYNTMVTLTATANATTSDFGGFTGAGCSTSPCTVTMSQAQTVTATFNLKQFALRIAKNPMQEDGFGLVTGNGLNCGTSCTTETVTLPYGTAVSLTATGGTSQSTLSNFLGWSGAGCMGTGGCTFTLTGNTTVFASFKLRPNLMFVTSRIQAGNFGGIGGADDICRGLAAGANLPGRYLAYISNASTGAGARIASFGASGWVRTDNAPVMNSISQFGGGTLFNAPVLDENRFSHAQSNSPTVWTATSDGAYVGQNCGVDWDSTSARTTAGLLTATDTTVTTWQTRPCTEMSHLYCLGIDRRATVP